MKNADFEAALRTLFEGRSVQLLRHDAGQLREAFQRVAEHGMCQMGTRSGLLGPWQLGLVEVELVEVPDDVGEMVP